MTSLTIEDFDKCPIKILSKDIEELYNLYSKLTWIDCDFEPRRLNENNESLLNQINILTSRINKDIFIIDKWNKEFIKSLSKDQILEYNNNIVDITGSYVGISGRLFTLKERNEIYSDVFPDFKILKSSLNNLNNSIVTNKISGLLSIEEAKKISIDRMASI
jgi:archaellum biogenesis ATPase FlaH